MNQTSVGRSWRRLAAVVAALVCTAHAAEAQRPSEATLALSGTDSVHVKRFLVALQSAVARDDSVAVGKLFQYPTLSVWDGHRMLILQRPEQLLPIYRTVFTPDLRRRILTATLDSLWANAHGVALGKGRLWFQISDGGGPRIAAVTGGVSGAGTPEPARP